MPNLIKTRGIVLKHTYLGEADKIITLFTDSLGKVQAVAHGARKAKSKLMSSTQAFAYCEFVLYKGKSLYTVSQTEIKASFQVLLNDLHTLTYSSYLMELVDVLILEGEENIELFSLLLKTLYLMTEGNLDKELIVRAFELKAISQSGYMPQFDNCILCGSSLNLIKFSSRLGGVLCSKCSENDRFAVKIDLPSVNTMKFFIKNHIEKVRVLKINLSIKNYMKKIMKNYIKYHLDKDFKSLDFLDEITNMDELEGVE
ncbi:DNA repair protein RecO [Oxobacter pfennigii]|nr:DNA repair protein RecO [Oxobacter pfennigii]